MPNAVPAWGYQLEYYINTGTTAAPTWVKATELLTWDVKGDANTYEPKWLERASSPTFTYGRSCSIDIEKDAMIGGTLDKWMLDNRNKLSIAVEIARVFTWLGTAGAYTADKAAFNFTPSAPSNKDNGQPANLSGTFNMTDTDWSEGTWNETTPAFTAATAPAAG